MFRGGKQELVGEVVPNGHIPSLLPPGAEVHHPGLWVALLSSKGEHPSARALGASRLLPRGPEKSGSQQGRKARAWERSAPGQGIVIPRQAEAELPGQGLAGSFSPGTQAARLCQVGTAVLEGQPCLREQEFCLSVSLPGAFLREAGFIIESDSQCNGIHSATGFVM